VHGGVAAADGCEQVANILPGNSVTTPADDTGQVVTAAEPEQHGDGVLHGASLLLLMLWLVMGVISL
jgi:ethylene-insensitive protein 3